MKNKSLMIVLLLTAVLAAVILLSRRGGDVRIVRRELGESQKFTQTDIESAMDAVERHFKKEFDGCTLITLTYEEAVSERSAEGWADNYDADEAIVLHSRFYVDASGGDGSFNPDSYYDNWQWVLTRTDGGKWKLQTWGYG